MANTKQTKFVYADNNATTRSCDDCLKAMTSWIQACSNPSGSSTLSQMSKQLIADATKYVDKHSGCRGAYEIIFTSGATESNCTFIRSVVDGWYKKIRTRPHIVTSSVEHKSVLDCLSSLRDRVDVTYVVPNAYGIVDPEAVKSALQPNTALVTVMFANNETGAINPVKAIGAVAHAANVPFHTDAVQIYGKTRFSLPDFNIDAMSASFHKFYGPMGVGLLIIRKRLIEGYGLEAQINGTQQNGYRGGTENVPGIAGALAAMRYNFNSREDKNKRLLAMRNAFISGLAKHVPVVNYSDLMGGKSKMPAQKRENCICIIGPPAERTNSYLPNTVLMSILDHTRPFCNVKFKKYLENKKIIVSIGSACNTKSNKASHVLQALSAPDYVKRGTIRVSFGDYNTQADVKKIITAIIDYLRVLRFTPELAQSKKSKKGV